MKNNIVVVLLVVLIGILSGLGLLFGISNAVQVAVNPMGQQLLEIANAQRGIDQKLKTSGGADNAQLMARLAVIEEKLTKISEAPAGAPTPAAQNAPPSEDMDKVHVIEVGSSPLIGKAGAPIIITQFTDLQCPFCARFYPPIQEALKNYPDKVSYLIKHFPLSFHPNARPAAKLALAANEQGKYKEMIELLLENGADASDAKIKEYAKKLGIKYNKLTADLKDKDAKYEQQVNDDTKLGGDVDVRGTPTFYINGKKTLARDYEGFKAEIEKILATKK